MLVCLSNFDVTGGAKNCMNVQVAHKTQQLVCTLLSGRKDMMASWDSCVYIERRGLLIMTGHCIEMKSDLVERGQRQVSKYSRLPISIRTSPQAS